MIKEFKTVQEALALIRTVSDKYQEDIEILTSGKSITGMNKLVSFILLTQPNEDNMAMIDEFILLKADGYPMSVEWQPKWGDQMDLRYELISVTVEIKVYRPKL